MNYPTEADNRAALHHMAITVLLFVLAMAASCLFDAARAADMQVYTKAPPARQQESYNWSGFYLEGFGDYSVDFGNRSLTLGSGVGALNIDLSRTPHGAGGGGGIEFLYQGGGSPWVLGLRGNAGFTDLNATASITTPLLATGPLVSVNSKTNFLGFGDVELGYAGIDPKLLAYVAGGVAFGQANASLNLPTLPGGGVCILGRTQVCNSSLNETAVGWNVGSGLRYALTPWSSYFVETDYTDLGTKTVSIFGPVMGAPPLLSTSVKRQVLTTMFGLTYKIGGSN
jgi:opacity protein-like surface antigen